MGECPDGKLALSRQPLGEQAEHHTLAGARIAADEREAAFTYQAVLDAPAEAVDFAGLQQRFSRQVGRERVEFKAVEAEQFLVHDEGSSSSGTYGGGRPVAANSAMSLLSSGAGSSRRGGSVAAAGLRRRRSPEALAVLSRG